MGKKEKKLVIKNNNNNKNKEVVKWDDLIVVHENAVNILKETVDRLKEMTTKYAKYINSNEKLGNDLVAISKSIEQFKNELDEIKSLHTVKNNKGEVVFRTGEVSTDDEKIMILFINANLAYEGFIEKITNYLDTTIVTFAGNLAEEVEKTKKGDKNGK